MGSEMCIRDRCVCVCVFVSGRVGLIDILKVTPKKMQRAWHVSETSTEAAATEAEGRASESSSAGKRTGEGTAVNSESGPPLQHIAHLWHLGSLTERERERASDPHVVSVVVIG